MGKRITKDEYISKLKNVKPTIRLIGEYINSTTKTECECLVCGYHWMAHPNLLLRGYGCPKCAGKLKKSQEQYVKELYTVNPNLKVIDTYINAKTKIKHQCNICGYEWLLAPLHSLQGKGCPKCSKVYHRTPQEYKDEVNHINPTIKVLGDYKNNRTKINHQCLICGYIWDADPSHILQGGGCPKCAIKRNSDAQRMTHLEYLHRLNNQNIQVTPLEHYVNNVTNILHKCNKCGYEWKVRPANILSGYGCPHCSMSKGEIIISDYLKLHNITFNEQYCFDDCKIKRVMPFDFYLPNYNMCIEYDGEHHFKPIRFGGMSIDKAKSKLETQKQRDLIKDKYCQDNNIKLLRIPYWDFNNIELILNNIFSPTTTE